MTFLPRRSRAALVTLALAGACGGGDLPTRPPGPTTAGTVLTITGQTVVAGPATPGALRVALRLPDGATVETPVDAAGAFSLTATLGAAPTDSLSLLVDAVGGAARVFQPVLVRATGTAAPRTIRPLLVPRAVTLPASSSFGSVVVPVSLAAAFRPVCTTPTDGNCNSFFIRDWLDGGVAVWPDSAFPVPVAFNRAGAAGAITPADSAAFWETLQRMEHDVGRPLFRPATLAQLGTPNSAGYSAGAILVSIDPTLPSSHGATNSLVNPRRDVYAARTRLASVGALQNTTLVTHEMLHALGFHHTCAWPTVMGGYGCFAQVRLTVEDVAAVTLATAVRQAQLAGAPSTGLAEARAGEQEAAAASLTARAGRASGHGTQSGTLHP